MRLLLKTYASVAQVYERRNVSGIVIKGMLRGNVLHTENCRVILSASKFGFFISLLPYSGRFGLMKKW